MLPVFTLMPESFIARLLNRDSNRVAPAHLDVVAVWSTWAEHRTIGHVAGSRDDRGAAASAVRPGRCESAKRLALPYLTSQRVLLHGHYKGRGPVEQWSARLSDVTGLLSRRTLADGVVVQVALRDGKKVWFTTVLDRHSRRDWIERANRIVDGERGRPVGPTTPTSAPTPRKISEVGRQTPAGLTYPNAGERSSR
jgi:hypothetical protein